MKRGALENLLGQLLPLAAVAVGLYWIYKRLPSAADISRAASEAMALATHPTVASQLTSAVMLPDGSVVAVGDIVNAGSIIDGGGNFTWQGVPYQISGSDPASGYYVAKRIVT